MSNCVFVETGQCGNQLGYALLDSLYNHLSQHDENCDNNYLETYFRIPYHLSQKPIARAVCLDTEPKVINESLSNASKTKWKIDPKSVAYRHGGAGNNWALGYEMASGEFLETSMNLIRRELEYCDYTQSLVFMHSVAGGTGSGLGTKISESCADEFPQSTRINIAIAPYHFGEVVVQHYNAVLCLSKISASSNAVLVFENEIAQMLCKTMKGIDRPSLDQLNQTIQSNICPLFLPKHDAGRNNQNHINLFSSSRYSLRDEISHLCSHPGYKFLDIKVTPQTSNKSVDFTYDSWSTLLKTIQQMQMSGAASERSIKSTLKHALHSDGTGYGHSARSNAAASPGSPAEPAPALSNSIRSINHSSLNMGSGGANQCQLNTVPVTPPGKALFSNSYATPPQPSAVQRYSPANNSNNSSVSVIGGDVVVRSLASVVTLYGSEGVAQAAGLQESYDSAYHPLGNRASTASDRSSGSNMKGSMSGVRVFPPTGKGGKLSALQVLQQQQQQAELQLHEMYFQSHSTLKTACGGESTPIKICASDVAANGYQRATSVAANSQAILPLLQRAMRGGTELFQAGAYLHQYSTYGIEEADFLEAFRSIGCAIQNYNEM